MGMVFDRVEGIGFVYCVQFISQLLSLMYTKKRYAIDKQKSLKIKAFSC